MAFHIRAVAKRAWIATLRILLLLLIMIILFVSWMVGTEGGRITLVKQGLEFWTLWSGQSIELVGIRTPSLSQWEIRQIQYQGANESDPLVELNGLELDWRWRYALQNRWWINQLTVQSVRLNLPEANHAGRYDIFDVSQLWSRIPAIRVDRLYVPDVEVTQLRYPMFQADLNVQMEINWGALPARFLVSMQHKPDKNHYSMQLKVDAIDQVRLQGSLVAHPDTAWAQWINWQLPEAAEAQWDVQVDYSQQNRLSVMVDQWSMPWQSHLLQGNGQITYQMDTQEFRFNPLQFGLDGQPAKITGTLAPKSSDLTISIDQWPIAPLAALASLSDIQGEASVQGQLQGGWKQPQFNGKVKADGHWQSHAFSFSSETQSKRSVLTIHNGKLALANNNLSLSGSLDWISNEVNINLQGQVASDPVFRPWLTGALADVQGQADLTGQIQGDIHSPTIAFHSQSEGAWQDDAFTASVDGQWKQGTVTLDQLLFDSDILQLSGSGSHTLANHAWQAELSVSRLTTDILSWLNIRLPIALSGVSTGDLHISGDALNFTLSGDMQMSGLWQEEAFAADVRIDALTPGSLRLGEASVHLPQASVEGSGRIDWSENVLDLTLIYHEWSLDNVAVWLPFWPPILETLHGDLTGKTTITGSWNQPVIVTDSEFVGSWFAEALTAQLKVNPHSTTNWAIPNLSAQWLGAEWTYQGDFAPYELELNGQARVQDLHTRWIPLLSRSFTDLEKALPEQFDVKLDAQTELAGPLTAPTLSGQAELEGALDGEPLSMSLDINHLDTNAIDIKKASGQWSDGQWQVSGTYDWQQTQVALNISTNSPDAHYLTPWLTLIWAEQRNMQWLEEWQGSLQGEVTLDNLAGDWLVSGNLNSTGLLYDDEYQLHWKGDGRLNEALSHELSAAWGAAEGSASLVSDATDIKGSVTVHWLDYGQLRHLWSAVPANLMGLLNADVSLEGNLSSPSYTAQLESVGQFQSKYAHRFNTDVSITGEGQSWKLSKTVFEIPGAISVSASGQGFGTQGDLLLEGVLPNTHYWITNEQIGEGEAGFQLLAEGDLRQPVLSGKMNWQAENWPISLNVDLATVDNNYQLNSTLYNNQTTRVKGSFRWAQWPLAQLLGQWHQVPITAELAVNTPLSLLDPFFITQPDIRLQGDIDGDLSATGTLAEPTWQGNLTWQNGHFEHALYGTLIRDISMTLDASADRWQLQASATDGRQGAMTISGDVSFLPQPDQILAHHMNIDVQFDNAHLLNQAQMEATLNGALNFRGAYRDLTVSGDMYVTSLNIQSDTFLADGAPQLNIVTQDQLLNAFDTERPFYWPQGNWNTNLIANQRVNLYGQGINAELEGTLRLAKDLYAPEVSGRFDLVRGIYSGLGKIFQLTEGSIRIENNQMVLDISGANTMNLRIDDELQSVEVTLRITGNQDALSLELTSDTDLEQDELLAQILFGKIIEDLDVLQAIQLANAVNKLRTGNSGFDPVGTTRDEIGLDSLVVDTETDEEGNLGLNISAGKYLNDYLYLEVESQVGSERELRGSLQYQLTPSTTLELYTQGQSGILDENGLELNWSLDY